MGPHSGFPDWILSLTMMASGMRRTSHTPVAGRLRQAIASLLVLALVMASVPLGAVASADVPSTPPPKPPQVHVNRQRPNVAPPPEHPTFSARPTTAEIRRARVFGEALVPVGRPPSDAENDALAAAITVYSAKGVVSDTEPLTAFLAKHGDSPWSASLLANLATIQRLGGFFRQAIETSTWAWQLAKDAPDPESRSVGDFAMGEAVELAATLGQQGLLESLLRQVGNRSVGGPAGAKVDFGRHVLMMLRSHPEDVIASGAWAVRQLVLARNPERTKLPSALTEYRPTAAGMTMAEVQALAARSGVTLVPATRSPVAPPVVPSIVHFTFGHFTALLAQDGDQYLVRDPAFDSVRWIAKAAIASETSEVALVPVGPLPTGWSPASKEAMTSLIGHSCTRGAPSGPPPCDHPPCCDPPSPGTSGPGTCKSCGMVSASLNSLTAGLRLVDTPVGYAPPRGPAIYFTLSYDQREIFQPQVMPFGNAGPLWTHNWHAYVEEEPAWCGGGICRGEWIRVFTRGGGHDALEGPPTNGVYTSSWKSHAQLVRTSTSPIQFERRLTDGSVEVYGQSDGGPVGHRRVFLTQLIDPQGQAVTLTYDAQMRLVALTDALGQVTTVAYEVPSDALKITSVTDPFGRRAMLTYTAAGQLASITDIIGLTSTMTYGGGDFVAGLITPYGTTTFRHEHASDQIWFPYIELTDPVGGTERAEYRWVSAELPATEGQVPTGFESENQDLDHCSSVVWGKRGWALGAHNVAYATVTRWMLADTMDYGAPPAVPVPQSIKRPLEARTWYQYPGQSSDFGGRLGPELRPSATGQLLDGGVSQVRQTTYNSLGSVTSQTDPLGRRASYSYATNGIDLLEVRQTTGSLNDLLASYAGYNAQHLPASVTDAAGQTTTFTYNAAGQPLTSTNAADETTTWAYRWEWLPPIGDGRAHRRDHELHVRCVRPHPHGHRQRRLHRDDRLRCAGLADAGDLSGRHVRGDHLRPARCHGPAGPAGPVDADLLRCPATGGGGPRPAGADDHPAVVHVRKPGRPDRCARQRDALGAGRGGPGDAGGPSRWHHRHDLTYEAASGRMATATDPKGQVTTYAYARDDRLTDLTFTNAEIATPSISFTYDADYPRVVTMADGTGTTSYGYHPAGSLGAGQVASVDGPLADDTITYTYDAIGRVTGRAINGVGLTLAYDALNRVTTETNVLGTFTYAYDGVSPRLATVTYPNSQTSSYTYLPNAQDHRLQTIHHKYPGGATLSKFDYTYDAIGNILTWQQQADNQVPVLWTYGYDAADQLTRAVEQTTDPTPAILKRYAYGYDQAGNRLTEQIDDAVTGWTYDSLNRLLTETAVGTLRVAGTVSEPATVTVNGQAAAVDAAGQFVAGVPVASGSTTLTIAAIDASGNSTTQVYTVAQNAAGRTFTYDANGNLTADGSRTVEWDARNQLVAVTVGTHRSEFTYNGVRRRVRIVEKDNGVPQSETKVVWCESDICEERAADGTTVTRRAFVYAEQVAGVARFFAMDHIGSVTDVTDAASAAVGRYAFDPWGRRTLVSGTDVTTVGFTGHRSFGTSLSLTLHRAYDADFGRWLSEDPIGLSDGPNLYAYVANRVTVWIDPLGLQKCCDELQNRRKRLHEILDQIDSGREPSGTGIGGFTVCAGNTPDPIDTNFIRKQMGPCLSECAIAHENRHAQQCRRFGAEHVGRNSRSMERSGYLVELGCIIQKIRSEGCCE